MSPNSTPVPRTVERRRSRLSQLTATLPSSHTWAVERALTGPFGPLLELWPFHSPRTEAMNEDLQVTPQLATDAQPTQTVEQSWRAGAASPGV